MSADEPTPAQVLAVRLTQLRAQRAALVTAIEQMRTTRSLTVADDEHDPEGSTVSLDQARDVALLERTERSLGELLAAQERLALGTFGSCERCGQGIPPERLRARPEARCCLPCAQRAELGRTGTAARGVRGAAG